MISALLHKTLLEVKHESDPVMREYMLRNLLRKADIDSSTTEDANDAFSKIERVIRMRRATEVGFVYLGK